MLSRTRHKCRPSVIFPILRCAHEKSGPRLGSRLANRATTDKTNPLSDMTRRRQPIVTKGLLESVGRRHISAPCYAHELTQATPSFTAPERRNDVLGVDRGEYPESAFLPHRLDVRRSNQATIRKSLIWPRANVTEHHANGTACMNMDIHQVGRDQAVVVLTHCLGDAKEVEVRVTLYV